jgi:hypothetical protein
MELLCDCNCECNLILIGDEVETCEYCDIGIHADNMDVIEGYVQI